MKISENIENIFQFSYRKRQQSLFFVLKCVKN